MKKITSFLLFATVMLFSVNSFAQCTTAANAYNNLTTAGGAPCDDGTGCVTTDAGFAGFGIYASEAYDLPNVQAGFDYVFDMCTGTGAGAWIPAITIVAPSGAVDAFSLGTTGTFLTNCSLAWTASESGLYSIVIHEQGVACGTGNAIDNGNPTVACGLNSASCTPPAPCVAGGLTTTGFPVSICPSDSFTMLSDGTESTPGAFGVFFSPQATGGGGLNGAFTLSGVTYPYTGDNDLQGVLSSNSFPVLTGEYAIYFVSYSDINDASNTICSTSTDSILVTFLSAGDPGCGPAPTCDAGVISTVGFPLNQCPGDSFTISTDGSETAPTDFAMSFSPQAGATGGGGAFTLSGVTFPYVGDEDLNGILSSQVPPIDPLLGTWAVYTAARDNGVICDISTDSVLITFLAASDPLCSAAPQPGNCEDLIISEIIEGSASNKCLELYNPTNQPIDLASGNYLVKIFNNGSAIANQNVALSGIVPAEGTFVICNANVAANFVTLADVVGGVMDEATFFNGDDAIELSKNSGTVILDVFGQIGFNPGTSGWVGTGTCASINQTLVRNTSVLVGDINGSNTFNIDAEWTCLPLNDISNLGTHLSNCAPTPGTPCTTSAAGPYTNLNTAGGAPCDDGTGCTPTTVAFGAWASEAYLLDNVQAGFDYVFDICSGAGAGAWMPAITIEAPSGAVDAFNLGTTGTFAMNCTQAWTASESGTYIIYIHEAGTTCLDSNSVDNGVPTVTCGPNPATCFGCVAGGLVSPTSVVVCGTDQDSIILDGTESTPGSYSVQFSDAAGGTGGLAGGFTIINIASFPWVYDTDVNGVLSAQTPPLPPLSGMWEMTVFNVDGTGANCDSITTAISVNFVDPSDPLCNPVANCAITALATGTQTACVSSTNTYEQDVIITFNDAPASGTLNVNGQTFAIGTSPQTVTLGNLTADGLDVNVTAQFSAEPNCALTVNALFNAPAACLCAIDVVDATTQSACNPTNNTYSQDVIVTSSNTPTTGTLNVNGQVFAVSASPQTITLTGLVADGNAVDIVASFSAIPACTITQTGGFTAPVSCSCSITDLGAGQSTPCVNTTNTYTQDVVVTYTNAPATGSLTVNGQNFTIGTSPQTVTLTGLTANSASVNVSASFTADPGCTYSENALFTAPAGCLCPTINVNVTTTQVTNCASPNGSATAIATGGTGTYNYVWTPNSFGSGPTISNIPSGSYSVVATDGNGCFGTSSGNVSNTSGVNALVGNVSNVSCFGGNNGSIAINATGGTAPISYTWSDQPGVPTSVSTKNNLTAGIYTIIVADAGNCSVTLGPITITQPNQLVVTVDNSSNVTCNGDNDGEINVTVTGGNGNNSYAWSNGGGNMEDASNLDGGNYTLTVTDAGCPSVSSNSVTIVEPAAISINLDGITDLDCFGTNSGSVLVSTSGGTGSLDYSWDNAPNIEDVLNASGGTYQLTVTDDNMCTETSPVYTIDEPTELVVNITGSSNVSCFNGNDGSITTDITGGTGVYTLVWTNGGGNSSSPANLSEGSYQLSVTDANGCNATSSLVNITAPTAGVTASATSTPENNNSADGTATASATGGSLPYSFSWNDAAGQTNSAATGLTAGTYICTITDDNGCSETVSVEVGKVNSINDIAVSELNIYPNPTKGSFNIEFETVIAIDFEITVMNTIGKTIMTNSYENVNGSFNEQFTLSNLSSGVYFIEISNKDAKSIYKITLSK